MLTLLGCDLRNHSRELGEVNRVDFVRYVVVIIRRLG
jgi:hypothetical protein